MATNYFQDGKTMDWSNSTGQDVHSGQAVAVGNIVGVAHADIQNGADGVLHMAGVFILPKVAEEAWDCGARLFLNVDGLLTAVDPGADTVVAGTAWNTPGAGDADCCVRLGY